MKLCRVLMLICMIPLLVACPVFDPPDINGNDPDGDGDPSDTSDGEGGYIFPFYEGAVWEYRVTARYKSDPEEVGTIVLTVTDVDASVPEATISVAGRCSGYPGGYSFPDTIWIRQVGDTVLERKTSSSATWKKTFATESWTGGEYILANKSATNRMDPSEASAVTDAGDFDCIKVRSYKNEFDTISDQSEAETVEQYFSGAGLVKSYHYYSFTDMSDYPYWSFSKSCTVELVGYEIAFPDGSVARGGAISGPDTIPADPVDLEVAVTNYSDVTLTWVDASLYESGFVIERSIDGGAYTEVTRVGANITTCSFDESIAESGSCTYRVAAYNEAGISGFTVSESVDIIVISTVDFEIDDSGYYRIYTNDPGNYDTMWYHLLPELSFDGPLLLSSAVCIEADVQRLSGASSFGYGVIFLHSDWDNYAIALITSTGFFSVQKKVSGVWSDLSDWSEDPDIHSTYHAINRLKVEYHRYVQTGELYCTVYANNSQLYYGDVTGLTVSGSTSGFLGFVGTRDSEDFPAVPVEFRFKLVE